MRRFWERERVTLVVENEVVRLMGVHRGSVTRWGSAPIPPNTVVGGAVADEVALAGVLERLWGSQTQQSPAPRDTLLLAISGHHVTSRVVALEGVNQASAADLEAVARAALPDPDSYLAWQVVGPSTQPSLFAVAAPASLIEGYLQVLKRAGLGAMAVDVKPLALIRAVGQRHGIIVDGERALGSIIVVDEALPRHIRFPMLQAALLASPEEKITRLAEVLHDLFVEVNRGGGQALHPGLPVYLTGSLADHALLRDVVQEVLGHPLGRVAPGIALPPDMPVSQFMTNIGLALKQV